MKNLRNGKYFNNTKTKYDIHVIEYQHRGLPHAHIVAQLHIKINNNNEACTWMDANINTTMPSHEDFEYFEAVNDFMMI